MTNLRQAAQAVVERWDTPAWEWRDQGPTADLMADLRKALAQPEQEPTQWRDMVVVSLVREGINKHRARELADHFATPLAAAQPEQQAEPVISAWSLREVYFDEDGEPLMHRSPPAAQPKQEPVVSLPYHPCTRILIAGLKDLHAWNVLHEWDKERKIVDDGMVATTSPAAQRPWQGLTDEDRRKFAAAQYGWEDLLIATEAKLKERNT